jgi:hypothetical protein
VESDGRKGNARQGNQNGRVFFIENHKKRLFRVTAVHRICIFPPGLSNYSVPIGLTQTDTCYVAIFAQKVSYYFPLENA